MNCCQPGESLYIFGYGSLLWRPDFPFEDALPGAIHGFHRVFHQGSTDHRGEPGQPGRVVTLAQDPTSQCEGLAYRVSAENRQSVLALLDQREQGGYERNFCTFHPSAGTRYPFAVLVYWAGPHNPEYLGPNTLTAMAAQIRSSAGPSGPNLEYLLRLADRLRELGMSDPHVFELEAEVLRQEYATASV